MPKPIEKYWRFVAQDNGSEPASADLLIFSSIGDPWAAFFGEESVWAKKFTEELWALPKSVKRLNIHINSPGGDVAEAQAIYSSLADYQAEKIVYIDGIAASAATIPAMVGQKVFIRSNANMMVHLPMVYAVGNANVLRDAIGMLESVTEAILNVYEKKTGEARDKLREFMEDETWFTAEEAVAIGFADEVRGVIKAAASAKGKIIFNGREFDLAPFQYKHTPAFPEAKMNMDNQPNTPPEPPAQPPAPDPAAYAEMERNLAASQQALETTGAELAARTSELAQARVDFSRLQADHQRLEGQHASLQGEYDKVLNNPGIQAQRILARSGVKFSDRPSMIAPGAAVSHFEVWNSMKSDPVAQGRYFHEHMEAIISEQQQVLNAQGRN